MTAAELNNRLRQILSTELGVYNNNTPSIWVYGSSSAPPSISSGLECLITQNPIGYAKNSSAGQKYKDQKWEVVLKNYKRDSKLVQAISRIEKNFVIAQITHFPFTNETIEQARILIKDPVVFTRI